MKNILTYVADFVENLRQRIADTLKSFKRLIINILKNHKKLIAILLLVYFMSVYMVIKGYHEIKENEKILSVHKEIKVCRLWNNNLKVLNGKCLADGVKAGYFNEGKYDFPEYSDKEKKCREDFDSLKKDFKARICGNGKIYLLYLSAKTVSSEENAAGADSSEQDIEFCSFNADHPKSAQIFLKDISEKSKSALRELDLCYKENTGRF